MAKSSATAASSSSDTWTNNNLACVYTWLDLNFIKELNTTFEETGVLTMKQLRFWNPAATPNARRLDAMAVATQVAKMFVGLNFAKYETGKNYATAVNEMTEVLIVATKTVADLALVVDDNHNFFGELPKLT
jgi:hypothetical protein